MCDDNVYIMGECAGGYIYTYMCMFLCKYIEIFIQECKSIIILIFSTFVTFC